MYAKYNGSHLKWSLIHSTDLELTVPKIFPVEMLTLE